MGVLIDNSWGKTQDYFTAVTDWNSYSNTGLIVNIADQFVGSEAGNTHEWPRSNTRGFYTKK